MRYAHRFVLRLLLALVTLCVLAGGAGAERFARPAPTDYLLGHSRIDDILVRFGAPQRDSLVERNGRSLRLLSYSLAAPGDAHAEGIRPARTLAFVFHDEILVGDTFTSSYAADHTDFDAGLARRIVRGKSRYADVIALLGRPAGWRIWPLTAGPGQRRIVYTYVHARETPQGLRRYRKTLTIDYGRNDVVTAIRLQTAGQP